MAEKLQGPRAYQALAVKHGLKALQKGFQLNTAYTPANLKRTAEIITGKKFKRGDYNGMIAAIEEILP